MRHKTYKILFAVSIIAILIASYYVGTSVYSGNQPTLLSFGIINFLGYLFFLLMPVEILFVSYLALDANITSIFIVTMATAFIAEIVDYAIGYAVSAQFISKIIEKKRYEQYEGKINKYGFLVIFVFNCLPLASSVVSLAAGMVRYKPGKFLFYTLTGLAAKYLAVILIFSSVF